VTDEGVWDAIVVGGGPAGSGVATYLAREGRRVLLLERERFPREHVGESLLPGVLPYLDALGARELVEGAGFERKEGQTFVWGRDRTPWDIDFRELDVHPYAFFVERARFDEILLRHAAASGAEVREQRAVTRVLFEGGRAVGVAHRGRGDDRGESVSRARFVVDATGQAALVARGADLRKNVRGLKNVALWSYWEGAARLPGPRRAHILTSSIPAGWIWVIPLGARTSVGVVTSTRASKAERELRGADAWYEEVVRACAPVQELLVGARRVAPVTAARDWSYRSRRLSGPGILLAGDAACFIDPILSTGVHLAMSSAYWASACIHSSLDDAKLEPFFRRFYDETYGGMYRELLAQVKAFYRAEGRRDSIYWASKEVLGLGSAVAPEHAFLFVTAGLLRNAVAAPHDVLAGVEEALGARVSVGELGGVGSRLPKSRRVSAPLVWRVGAEGAARLVTVHAEGLRLSLLPHEPRGVHDRPKGSYFVIELVDAKRDPVCLALVEERRAPSGERLPSGLNRLAVDVVAYPVRRVETGLRLAIQRALERLVAGADDGAVPLRLGRVRARLRRALREPGALPAGIGALGGREHRGGSATDAALTAVFQATRGGAGIHRVYLDVERRLPPELTGIPVLRTRLLDVWVRPERSVDGRPLGDIPEAASLVDRACVALWSALAGVTSRAVAYERAAQVLGDPTLPGPTFVLVACGRLGEGAAG